MSALDENIGVEEKKIDKQAVIVRPDSKQKVSKQKKVAHNYRNITQLMSITNKYNDELKKKNAAE